MTIDFVLVLFFSVFLYLQLLVRLLLNLLFFFFMPPSLGGHFIKAYMRLKWCGCNHRLTL
jgi:hypothetical protein